MLSSAAGCGVGAGGCQSHVQRGGQTAWGPTRESAPPASDEPCSPSSEDVQSDDQSSDSGSLRSGGGPAARSFTITYDDRILPTPLPWAQRPAQTAMQRSPQGVLGDWRRRLAFPADPEQPGISWLSAAKTQMCVDVACECLGLRVSTCVQQLPVLRAQQLEPVRRLNYQRQPHSNHLRWRWRRAGQVIGGRPASHIFALAWRSIRPRRNAPHPNAAQGPPAATPPPASCECCACTATCR